MWWKKKQTIHALELHDVVGKMRQDTTALYQWVEYLYRLNLTQHTTMNSLHEKNEHLTKIIDELKAHAGEHKKLIGELHEKVHTTKMSSEEIRSLIDGHQGLDQLRTRVHAIEQKVSVQHTSAVESERSSQLPLKEKILRRISRNSKEYIKGVIRGLIFKYGRISALQLRDIVVDEQGLCSKSSFYRLLDEVETDEGIAMEQDGKEKEYSTRVVQKSRITDDN